MRNTYVYSKVCMQQTLIKLYFIYVEDMLTYIHILFLKLTFKYKYLDYWSGIFYKVESLQ